MWHCLVAALFGATTAHGLATRHSITPLSSSQIGAFTPYSYYSTVAYCTPAQTLAWNCGGMYSVPSGFFFNFNVPQPIVMLILTSNLLPPVAMAMAFSIVSP